MTPFAQTILDTLIRLRAAGKSEPSTYEIGAQAFPEMWQRPATHGGIVSRIRRVAQTMPEVGLLPPQDRWDAACLYLKEDYRAKLAQEADTQ